MPARARLLIGLIAALLAGWIAHGPLGQGERFLAGLDAGAQAVVAEAELPAVSVRMDRAPRARRALLAGPADPFQREGRGNFPGLSDRILGLDGIGAVRWTDEPEGRGLALPLLVETELMVLFFFGLGLALGWRLFRPRRQGYL